uniref:Uncharacterized protein n=1 Tax=viral metagenome TaxID=1070528 RepID=A0A6C0H358_9ZZZZ
MSGDVEMIDQKTKMSQSYICNELSEVYNATLLNQLDQSLKDAFKTEACKDNKTHDGKKRKVLSTLISNYFNKTVPIVYYLGGPFSLTCQWSKEYKKLIYIFGEAHSWRTDCFKLQNKIKGTELNFENYLKQFIPNSSSFLDIFIELHARVRGDFKYKKPIKEYNVSPIRLYKIASEFEECLSNINSDKDECKLSRFHYIDVRSIEREKGPDPISNFIIEYYAKLQLYRVEIARQTSSEKKFTEQNFVDELIKFITENASTMNNFLKPENDPDFDTFWTDNTLEANGYVLKELDRLEKINGKTELAKRIKDFIKEELLDEAKEHSDKIRKLATNILSNIYVGLRTYVDDLFLIKHIEDLAEYVLLPNSRVPDAYTLARIFKNFNLNPEKIEKKRNTDEPEEAHNIIIYAGDNHCEIYRKFFHKLNFTPIARIGGNPDTSGTDVIPINCIDMRPIPATWKSPRWSIQPLFSGWPPPAQPNLININGEKKSSRCSVMMCEKESDYINNRLYRDPNISKNVEEYKVAKRVIETKIPLFTIDTDNVIKEKHDFEEYLKYVQQKKENNKRVLVNEENESSPESSPESPRKSPRNYRVKREKEMDTD